MAVCTPLQIQESVIVGLNSWRVHKSVLGFDDVGFAGNGKLRKFSKQQADAEETGEQAVAEAGLFMIAN